MAIQTKVPSLASLAAEAFLAQPELALQSYRDSKYDTYTDTVKHITEFDVDRMQHDLERLKLPENIFIYTSGSDGKLEKANRSESPVELLVVCDTEAQSEIAQQIDEFVHQKAITIDHRIEWKDLKKETLVECNITGAICPSRFMHNLPLHGTEKQREELTLQFVQEVQSMSGSNRRKFRDKFVKLHTKQMNDVISGKDTRDVNLTTGELSYSGMGRKATKYPLLRPIQYTLDLVLIDAIRSKKATPEEYAALLLKMPRTVPDQIDYMFVKGLLPKLKPQDVTDLKAAYKLGLFYFQTAQHVISTDEESRPITFVIPDKAELKKAFEDTQAILGKM
ncbi:hypothetical protein [Simkania sp.]|uniref:hypothetical protein n=1 Tax=Simkania sp. TaxID=34094 RepID=UPI003B518056